MTLLTTAEFRRIRDQEAVRTYRKRWKAYKDRKDAPEKEIAEANATLSTQQLDTLKIDKKGPYYELQHITAAMTEMERDAVIRKQQLGNDAWEAID